MLPPVAEGGELAGRMPGGFNKLPSLKILKPVSLVELSVQVIFTWEQTGLEALGLPGGVGGPPPPPLQSASLAQELVHTTEVLATETQALPEQAK